MSQFLLLILLLLLSGSMFVWQTIVSRWWASMPVLAYREREQVHRDPFLFVFVLVFVLWPRLATLLWPREHVASLDLGAVRGACVEQMVIFVIMLMLLSLAGRGRLKPFGFSFDDFGTQMLEAVQGITGSVLPVGAILLGMYLLGLRSEETQHPYLQLLREQESLEVILWVGIAAVVLAPLLEELLYRVILQGWLQNWIPANWAIVVVAVFFCSAHSLTDSFPLLPLALILGYVYDRSNRYWTVVTLHAGFNAGNLLLLLLSAG